MVADLKAGAIDAAEFDSLLAGFCSTAFRLEAQPFYAVGEEQDAYERFLAGEIMPPHSYSWWQGWLDMISQLTHEGKTVSRVRVLTEPPTDYQRWERAGDPWHALAGEQIAYLPRGRAALAGLPVDDDWWLLDNSQVILMRFTLGGEITDRTLITDPGEVARFKAWRHLAVQHATPAGANAAA